MLDVVSHWLGPNIYVNHSHVTWRPAGAGAPHAWHRDGGTELRSCSRTFPMFLKVGFVLTDMSEPGKGNIGCVPISRAAAWGEVPRDKWTARPTSERAIVQPDGSVRSVKAIVNADTLLLKAGTAVLFEQCWHSGLSNAHNADDRCVMYVQYARRFLQPMDPARYDTLRELQPCSPVRRQLLLLPSDVEYLPNNRSSLYYPPKTLPLLERQRERQLRGRPTSFSPTRPAPRAFLALTAVVLCAHVAGGIPSRRYEQHDPTPLEGFVSKIVPAASVAQIDALIEARAQGHWHRLLSLSCGLNLRAASLGFSRRARNACGARMGGFLSCAAAAVVFALRPSWIVDNLPSWSSSRVTPILANVGVRQLCRHV